jgi:hypothetical protein
MDALARLLALYVSIGIANLIWIIVCIIIYPFKKKWIYSFEKTTKYFLETLIEARK